MYCILFAIWLLVCHWISIHFNTLPQFYRLHVLQICSILLTLITQSLYPPPPLRYLEGALVHCLLFRSRSHLTPLCLMGSLVLCGGSAYSFDPAATLPPPPHPLYEAATGYCFDPAATLPSLPPPPRPLYEAATAYSFNPTATLPPPPLRGSHCPLFRSYSHLPLPPPPHPSTRQPLPTICWFSCQ